MPKIKINNINIYYEIRGTGEPLLLIMGYSTDISEWETVIAPLAKKFQVIAFDNRGSGRTDMPDIPYSIEMMADDAVGLMDALKIGSANVVGISMGGRIALKLALKYPAKIKKLVLVSAAAKSNPKKILPFLAFLSNLPIFRSKYPQPHFANVRQRQASIGFDETANLGKIKIPTLIMRGRKDRLVPYNLIETMHQKIANSKLVEFKGGHLFPLFDERQKFLEEVNIFLSRTN